STSLGLVVPFIRVFRGFAPSFDLPPRHSTKTKTVHSLSKIVANPCAKGPCVTTNGTVVHLCSLFYKTIVYNPDRRSRGGASYALVCSLTSRVSIFEAAALRRRRAPFILQTKETAPAAHPCHPR